MKKVTIIAALLILSAGFFCLNASAQQKIFTSRLLQIAYGDTLEHRVRGSLGDMPMILTDREGIGIGNMYGNTGGFGVRIYGSLGVDYNLGCDRNLTVYGDSYLGDGTADTVNISGTSDSTRIFTYTSIGADGFVLERNNYGSPTYTGIGGYESGGFGAAQINTTSYSLTIDENPANQIQIIGDVHCTNSLSVTDTFFLSGDTLTGITPLDSITGNIANSTTFSDSVFTSRLISKRIGLNTLTTNSKLDVFTSGVLGNEAFVFSNKGINLNVSTWAESIDSAAIFGYFDADGDPRLSLVSKAGVTFFHSDQNNYLLLGLNTYNTYEGALYNTSQVKIFGNTIYGLAITNAGASGTASGAGLALAQNDGTVMTSGERLAIIRFSGNYATGATNVVNGAQIRSYAEGTWSSISDHGANMVFYTSGDGSGVTDPVERLRITGNGGEAWLPVAQTGITAAGGITAAMESRILYYTTASAINITANPQFVDGIDGQFITLVGSSDVNTLTLDDGTGLQLAGGVSFVLGSGDTITLLYMATLDLWVEISRSDN